MRTTTKLERWTIPVDGGSLEVVVGGVGSPALCEAPHPIVPGVTAPCGPLAGLGQVVRVSPRGPGGSTPWRGPLDATIEQLADDLETVRVGLGIGPWVIVGHSAGGFVALEYARRHPSGAAGLVLVATSLGLRPLYAAPRSRNSALHPHWQAELAAHPIAAAPARTDVFRMTRVRDGLWMALEGNRPLTPLPIPDVPADLAARLEQTLAFDPLPWLGEIRVPALIVCGGADDIVPLGHCEALQAVLPAAELIVFECSGHSPMNSEPAAYRAAVERFLARLRGDSPQSP